MLSNVLAFPIEQVKQDDVYLLLETYRDLDRQIKALTEEKEKIGTKLKTGYFSTYESLTYGGRLLATYKMNIVKRFNQSLMKEERPEIYEAYLEEKEERRLLLK